MTDGGGLLAHQAVAAVRRGETTPTDLLEQCLDRIDHLNDSVNAVIWQDRDRARALARQLDTEAASGEFRGPLHGIPMTVKEAFDLVGAPTTWGNPAWSDNISQCDADVVTRLRSAGAVIFGKTNVPLMLAERQSHNAIYGTTNNPWDLTRTPGGSSGGSAAALATEMTMLEVGSDIGSSIRNPAHYCGVFGLRPTYGTISITGHMPPGVDLDADFATVGPLARSAHDLELTFDVIAGASAGHESAWRVEHRPDERTSLSEFRVGLLLSHGPSPIDSGYADELGRFADALSDAGAAVITGVLDDFDLEQYFDLHTRLLAGALAFMADPAEVREAVATIDALDDPTLDPIRTAATAELMSHGEWLRLDMQRRAARRRFDQLFEEIDILLTPVVNSPAFPHDHSEPWFARTIPVNGEQQSAGPQGFWQGISSTIGLPSAVGPIGLVGGLPVGYQAIAGHGRDRTALAFAKAAEAEYRRFVAPPSSTGG